LTENTNLWREKSEAQFYQIRLKGYLNPDWSDWFDGLTIRHEENGETLLSGFIADQSALFGIFLKIQNLGITLLSVINTKPPI
jgi:hypothetical protein